MTIRLTNPTGINKAIDLLQVWLQGQLFALWGIDPLAEPAGNEYRFYPKVYRNVDPGGKGFIAELYTGENNYEEVFWNDQLKGLTWFGQGPRVETVGQIQTVDIHLVTFANLKTLYPAITHRADEEIRQAFQRIFEAPIYGFSLVSTEIWLQNVLREYPGSRRDDRLIAADMGDVHAFRLNLKLECNPAELC